VNAPSDPARFFAATTTPHSKFAELDVSVAAWVALLAVIGLMLAVDLIRHRDDHEPTPREAFTESAIWVTLGLSFALVVALVFGAQASGEYLSGYLIEKSLSVDNVFVWAMLFTSLNIPTRFQHRVLFWGIFGALTLRAGFIFAGSAIVSRFWWSLFIAGAFLVYTGVKVIRPHGPGAGHGTEPSEQRTPGLGLLRRFVPLSDRLDGHHFVSRVNGRRVGTPLLAALVVIEITDVIFAVDSVPAVLAVSREPFLVFSSNAFAILGLRAMYFLLAGARDRFQYLGHSLGAILIFVGVKMMVSHWVHIPTFASLAVIAVALTAGVLASRRRAPTPNRTV
jgi:tellurite resistance protein TerC